MPNWQNYSWLVILGEEQENKEEMFAKTMSKLSLALGLEINSKIE